MELVDKKGLTEEEFLKSYKAKDYPRPSVTVDMLVFALNDSKTELLMIKRGGHPFLGKWALPGGFLNPNESAESAAQRELKEETHAEGLYFEQLGVYSEPNRDPRSWVISCAFMAVADKSKLDIKADDDAADTNWFEVTMSQEGDTSKFALTLKAAEIVLSANIEIKHISTEYGDKTELSILSSDGIAFDHAKMIADGLIKLKSQTK